MAPYPVQLDVTSPPRFQRIHLLLRLLIVIALGWLGITAGRVTWLLYLVLPVYAAIVVSSKGDEHYLRQTASRLWRPLTWLLSFSAYMLMITDEIPIDSPRVRTELRPTGTPSISSALGRLVLSIPSAIALFFVGFVSFLLCVIAFFAILFTERVPASILRFQKGYVRWEARLLAYHASLVEQYPPFTISDHEQELPTAMVNP